MKVPVWDAKRFDHDVLLVEDIGPAPAHIIQTTRLGIPHGRDEHLMYRFVDAAYAPYCTRTIRCDGGRSKVAIIFYCLEDGYPPRDL